MLIFSSINSKHKKTLTRDPCKDLYTQCTFGTCTVRDPYPITRASIYLSPKKGVFIFCVRKIDLVWRYHVYQAFSLKKLIKPSPADAFSSLTILLTFETLRVQFQDKIRFQLLELKVNNWQEIFL